MEDLGCIRFHKTSDRALFVPPFSVRREWHNRTELFFVLGLAYLGLEAWLGWVLQKDFWYGALLIWMGVIALGVALHPPTLEITPKGLWIRRKPWVPWPDRFIPMESIERIYRPDRWMDHVRHGGDVVELPTGLLLGGLSEHRTGPAFEPYPTLILELTPGYGGGAPRVEVARWYPEAALRRLEEVIVEFAGRSTSFAEPPRVCLDSVRRAGVEVTSREGLTRFEPPPRTAQGHELGVLLVSIGAMVGLLALFVLRLLSGPLTWESAPEPGVAPTVIPNLDLVLAALIAPFAPAWLLSRPGAVEIGPEAVVQKSRWGFMGSPIEVPFSQVVAVYPGHSGALYEPATRLGRWLALPVRAVGAIWPLRSHEIVLEVRAFGPGANQRISVGRGYPLPALLYLERWLRGAVEQQGQAEAHAP